MHFGLFLAPLPPPPATSAEPAVPPEAPAQHVIPTKVPKQEPPHEQPPPPKEVVPGSGSLAVGRRVLISGVKPGVLRYVGKTHIAPGYWCGVELFDASGLHDGEVDGKRYFSCKPFRGIFAPLDKVVLDETPEGLAFRGESKSHRNKITEGGKCDENDAAAGRRDARGKSPEEESVSSKLPGPGKSQIARLSGIPRVGAGGGVVKSTSADALTRPEKAASSGHHKSLGGSSEADLNKTFTLEEKVSGRVRTVSEGSDADGSLNQTYSCTVEKQLQSDSRRYFNITFNKDTPPSNGTTTNLPDVVSSASPSQSPPSRDGAGKTVPGALNQTQSAQDIALALASDVSLGLMEPDILADETNLLEGLAVDRVTSSASESDISQSNSSTLDEASVATVAEAGIGLTSTPLQSGGFKKFREDKEGTVSGGLCEAETAKSFDEISTSDVKRNLAQTFAASAPQDSVQRKDSSSSSNNSAAADCSFPQKQELLQEEGSNGISPEVSQVLEWDYDHDAFDGKLLEKSAESMSTSTSDSCSEASADPGVADKGIVDVEAPVSEMEEANQFDEPESDGFENIDDFPLGMSRDAKHMMTDSGISEKGFGDLASDTASKRRSVEFDSKVSVVAAAEASGTEMGLTVDNVLQQDLMDGHNKRERPLSLVSTTSADTGK
nr:hypothetical protein BaRGS_018057 [Batillaria attramentaria]